MSETVRSAPALARGVPELSASLYANHFELVSSVWNALLFSAWFGTLRRTLLTRGQATIRNKVQNVSVRLRVRERGPVNRIRYLAHTAQSSLSLKGQSHIYIMRPGRGCQHGIHFRPKRPINTGSHLLALYPPLSARLRLYANASNHGTLGALTLAFGLLTTPPL